MSARVERIVAIDRTVADLARSEAFYREGLGFAAAGTEPVPGAVLEAMGLAGASAARLTMRLGGQTLTLTAFDPPGRADPQAPLATDPVFQHVAVPVRDMGRAYARLRSVNPVPISEGGPQILPPSSGGVTAYKFRDPDGHPGELIHFPDGPPAERWAEAPGLFLGIDHSAITVTDRAGATAFFRDVLGLSLARRGLNRGAEQARLDGVPDPEVDVIALEPAGRATPHAELLHYRRPAIGRPAPPRPRDRATTRFVFALAEPAAMATAISAAGWPVSLSRDGRTAYAEGPDGHGMLLVPSTA